MVNYEPELMYALDSKGEYADWKNVYNVSGDDVLYCPICLGRVKLWNGQDPDKTYKKQRCFHHIDGMCSQESRIHFAYKTWLLGKGNKFKVRENIYEVVNSEIEKTLHTKFGDYRPDITVETTEGKEFYIEIADTNKKTDDYIEKWDDLGCDVLELDVNEQLIKATINEIPEFKIIYSSTTGECYIKHYTRQDYDDLITERKIYWKRKDLLKYKIQWERLDWFWRKLQDFYLGKSKIETLIEAFKQMDSSDQRFVCKRMRGKHLSLKYELENNYTDKNDLESAHLRHISSVIRKLNQEFGFSSCNEIDKTYLCREKNFIYFKNEFYYINESTKEVDVYNYFHPIMQKYYKEYIIPLQEKIKKFEYILVPQLENFEEEINNCKNKFWKMHFVKSYKNNNLSYVVYLSLLDCWSREIDFHMNEVDKYNGCLKNILENEMDRLFKLGKTGCYENFPSLYYNIRIMEER